MARLLGVERLAADGFHNAFTDLLLWRDHYYVCFRQAQGHGMNPPGDVIIQRSPDGRSWSPCARLDTGADDRDPKLVDAGDQLGVVFGSWFPRWTGNGRTVRNAEFDLVSHVAVSRDGLVWSTPRQVYGVNYWLWRIMPAADGFYCPAYHFGRRDDRVMRTVHLLHSRDLFDWRLCGLMRSGGGAGESVLFQEGPQELRCITRSLEPRHHSWLGRSQVPFDAWSWQDLGVMIHAPVVLRLGADWLVAGRSQEEDLPAGAAAGPWEQQAETTHHTSVWRLCGDAVEHLLTVPSAGDTSYAGLAPGPDGQVLMSYYSQHERLPLPVDPPVPADVYLARLLP